MPQPFKIIERDRNLVQVLEYCKENRIVFEAQDPQHNLFSLGIDGIMEPGPSDTNPETSKDPYQILTAFKPLQTGSSELQLNCQYTFSFRNPENTYYFDGILLNGDPESFLLSFKLRNEIYRFESRRSHRVSARALGGISTQIEGKFYQVINLSMGGVGIHVPNANRFHIGRELIFKLLYGDQVFTATGTVKHIAPLSGNGFICGIALTYLNEDSIHYIRKFIEQTQQRG